MVFPLPGHLGLCKLLLVLLALKYTGRLSTTTKKERQAKEVFAASLFNTASLKKSTLVIPSLGVVSIHAHVEMSRSVTHDNVRLYPT